MCSVGVPPPPGRSDVCPPFAEQTIIEELIFEHLSSWIAQIVKNWYSILVCSKLVQTLMLKFVLVYSMFVQNYALPKTPSWPDDPMCPTSHRPSYLMILLSPSRHPGRQPSHLMIPRRLFYSSTEVLPTDQASWQGSHAIRAYDIPILHFLTADHSSFESMCCGVHYRFPALGA